MAPILPNLQPNLPTLAAPRAQTPADRARTDRSEFRELLGRERGADRGRGLKLGHDPEHRAIGRRRKEDGCTCPGDEPSTQPTQPTAPVDDAPTTDAPADPPTGSATDGSTPDGSTETGATGGAQTGAPNGDAAAGDASNPTDGAAKPDAGTVVVGTPGTSTIDATAGVKTDPAATDGADAATSVKTALDTAPTNAATNAPTTAPTDALDSGAATTATADASNAGGADPKAPAAQGATASTTTANDDAGSAAAAAAAASASDAASAAAASKASAAATTAATVAGSASAAAATEAARAGNSNDPLARLVEAGQVAIRDTRRAPESATAGRLAEVEASIARDRVRAATGMPSRDGEGTATGPTVPGEGLALGFSRAPGLARDAAELPKGLSAGFSAAMGAELADDSATPAAAQLAAKGAELLANQRGGTITMRLDPPELGAMRIEIRIAEGAVFADFEAQNPEARALLESNLSMLRRRLESQGLAVERLTVHGGLRGTDAAQPGSRQDGSETRQQGSDGRERGEGSGARQDAAGGESRGRRDGDAAEGRERMDLRSRRGESGGFAGVLGGIDDAPRAARRAG